MPVAALLTWLMTAAGGLFLLTIWLIEYDREFQSSAATRLPVPVISTHALLAVTGLGFWAIYLLTGADKLSWIAAAILGVVAVLGLSMAVRWIGVYRVYGSHSRRHRVPVAAPAGLGGGFGAGYAGQATAAIPPERHFPVLVVILHGVFALATIVLVLFTALGHRS
ncbi:MAG TPA: hypothetical protein VMH35_08405 [Streptosporangiaceae bacterium]|nr:hypothetical protein [Streptosporangiaceae bacterium]